jgi:hypothetical protein
MKKYLFILAALALYACNNEEPAVRYRQFTKDDLSHIYYDNDTLTFTGNDIVYNETLTYLLNDTDIIHVPVKTEIYAYYASPIHFSNIEDIYGSSVIYFDKKTGFEFADIRLYRTVNSWNAEKFFQVRANGTNVFSGHYYPKDTVSLDTALVLGKIYQDVYKFYPPEEDKTDIRLIYFAKKYGYIKIEKLDGTKIERIDRSK